ncbi:MAG: hypothetical protein IT307_00730, partial [Chloroflexi bacterium]|nr:hypothetical protein [Chloroflexota bacterium]
LAIDALVEGDATISMLLWGRAHLTEAELAVVTSGGGDSSIDRAPPVVRDEVLFPYNDGALFVLQLVQHGGFEAVNAAFHKPPASTEQILHPEKYLAQDAPVEIALPDLAATLGQGWRQLRSDVLGELDYRILLEQYVDPLAAARGSYGWGGDRFSLLQSDNGAIALALSSVWDTETDAQEFFSIYADTVRQRYGRRAVPTEEGPTRLSWSTPNGPLRLRQAGKQVWLVMADGEREASILMGALTGEAPTLVPTPGRAPAQVPVQLPR